MRKSSLSVFAGFALVMVAAQCRAEGCVPTVSFDPPNYTNHTVAMIDACAVKAYTTWTLLTNPDGVTYEAYNSVRAMIHNNPSPHGPVLRMFGFIAGNPVCFDATTAEGTVRVAMLDTPQSVCDALEVKK